MRKLMLGLAAAIAVVTVSAAPALACGLFDGCSPCGQPSPCAQPVYVPPPEPVYSGCNCGGTYERLPDPVQQYEAAPVRHQYYYVNQGPTYTGPGEFAPRPRYEEPAYGYRAYPRYRSWHHHYGYEHRGYEHHAMRYGYMPHHYGYREHVLRRYY